MLKSKSWTDCHSYEPDDKSRCGSTGWTIDSRARLASVRGNQSAFRMIPPPFAVVIVWLR